MEIIKIISGACVLFLLVWLILLGLGKIRGLTFWIPVALIAVFAYLILPKLKKRKK